MCFLGSLQENGCLNTSFCAGGDGFPIPALEWHTQNKHQLYYQLGTGRSWPCLHGWDALVISDAFPVLVHGWKRTNHLGLHPDQRGQ